MAAARWVSHERGVKHETPVAAAVRDEGDSDLEYTGRLRVGGATVGGIFMCSMPYKGLTFRVFGAGLFRAPGVSMAGVYAE